MRYAWIAAVLLLGSWIGGVALPILAANEGADDHEVEIRRIRIRINSDRYVWEQDADIPHRHASLREENASSPATVLSFLDIVPGQRLRLEQLEGKISNARLRLQESGFFYTSSIQIVPARTDPARRTITVVVEDGFRARYGGGVAFGFIGRVNSGGQRRFWGVTAGINRVQAFYRDELLYNSPFFWEVSARYQNKGLIDEGPLEHSLQGALAAGYRVHPDWQAGVAAEWMVPVLAEGARAAGHYLRPEWNLDGRWILANRDDVHITLPLSAAVWAVQPLSFQETFPGLQAAGALRAQWQSWSAHAKMSGQYAQELPPPFLTEVGYVDRLQAARFLRGYARGCFRAAELQLSSMLSLELSPFVFSELVAVGKGAFETLGGGIEFYFGNPVHVRSELSAGINLAGDWRISFQAVSEL